MHGVCTERSRKIYWQQAWTSLSEEFGFQWPESAATYQGQSLPAFRCLRRSAKNDRKASSNFKLAVAHLLINRRHASRKSNMQKRKSKALVLPYSQHDVARTRVIAALFSGAGIATGAKTWRAGAVDPSYCDKCAHRAFHSSK